MSFRFVLGNHVVNLAKGSPRQQKETIREGRSQKRTEIPVSDRIVVGQLVVEGKFRTLKIADSLWPTLSNKTVVATAVPVSVLRVPVMGDIVYFRGLLVERSHR